MSGDKGTGRKGVVQWFDTTHFRCGEKKEKTCYVVVSIKQ